MKKVFITLCIVIVFVVTPVHAGGGKKILVVASNLADMGDPERHDARNNLWEYAPPYHIFISHGYEVDFASPAGGLVPFMMDPLGISSYTIKYEGFLDKANSSLAPEKIKSKDYSAVFIGGGYGTLFDVASNNKLLNVMAEIYENGGVIGSCGHGAGAFANVKLANGHFLVRGKRVAGFPNSTEKEKDWAKQGELLPFLVEERLKQNGAVTINKSNIPDKHDVVVDSRIVSTMFLPSAALVAKEMILLLEHSSMSSAMQAESIRRKDNGSISLKGIDHIR
jgi:putative intracellular protease/amidase